jgi:hypothetical protein
LDLKSNEILIRAELQVSVDADLSIDEPWSRGAIDEAMECLGTTTLMSAMSGPHRRTCLNARTL